jgi:DNA segregation ATPase FtsK/SpoIIIE, S-DNA-T family
VHEHAGKGDLEPLAQVCHRYVSSLDDESIAYSAESLRLLRAELQRRSAGLKRVDKAERPDGKVTRELAARRSLRLRPIVAVFDEIQNLLMHPQLGAKAADDASYVIRIGRAYGIVLVMATQRPNATSLPTSISGNMSARFCLKVPGQLENDIVLGTSSYKNGHKATAFRTKTDAGTRARVIRQEAGVLSGYALGLDGAEQPRSFAADVLSVFGANTKLWCTTIAARLADRIPQAYADTTGPRSRKSRHENRYERSTAGQRPG